MTCDDARILLHALIDGELDAGHALEVEAHIAGCAGCTAEPNANPRSSERRLGASCCRGCGSEASMRWRRLAGAVKRRLTLPIASRIWR